MSDLRKVTKLVELQLVGLDSNSFVLMGAFKQAARRQATPKGEIDAVLAECMRGDYNHLLCTLMDNVEEPDDEEYEEDEDDEYEEENYYR